VDQRPHLLADVDSAGDHAAAVDDEVAGGLLRVADLDPQLAARSVDRGPDDRPLIADLAAALAVEGRAVEDDLHVLPRPRRLDPLAAPHDGEHLPGGLEPRAPVPGEFGVAELAGELQVERAHRLLPRAGEGGALPL